MKNDYKKLTNEWGSKARKQEARQKKSTLRKPSREELAEAELENIGFDTMKAMANPPPDYERCGNAITEFTRQWDGSRWMCDPCAEETAK